MRIARTSRPFRVAGERPKHSDGFALIAEAEDRLGGVGFDDRFQRLDVPCPGRGNELFSEIAHRLGHQADVILGWRAEGIPGGGRLLA